MEKNNEKLLLQIIMKSKIITEKELNTIHGKIFGKQVVLSNTINILNSKINKLNLTIGRIVCEVRNEPVYVMYATTKPVINILDKSMTFAEKEYLLLVLHELFHANTNELATTAAINLSKNSRSNGLTRYEAEEFISDLIEKGFLMYVNKKKTSISYSPLTLLELESEIRELFKVPLKECTLCKQILLHGITCDSCQANMHLWCLTNLFKSGTKCPECSSEIAGQT